MRVSARGVASAVSLAAALAGTGYTAFAIARLDAFGRRLRPCPADDRTNEAASEADRRRDDSSSGARRAGDPSSGGPARRPCVTVLKPVYGLEPGLEANLRSFCVQNYAGRWNVVLGVHRDTDAALPVLRRIATAFPHRVSVVVGDGVARHRNPKIANVTVMLDRIARAGRECAADDVVIVADSDMRVTPDYLDAIADAFADPSAGAVTAIYRGEPADDRLASTLGAMWIDEQFTPSVLVANALEPLAYTFGATMAVRRDVLEAIGGFDALGDQLADDHLLGRLVARHGYRVALARYVVANTVGEPGLRALVAHELRWARTIRAVRPSSYLGIVVTYPLPLAVVYLALARDRRRAAGVVALAMLGRIALHAQAHRVLRTRRRPRAALLLPLRDALGVAVWLLGLRGNTVRWRGDELRIARAGELDAGP